MKSIDTTKSNCKSEWKRQKTKRKFERRTNAESMKRENFGSSWPNDRTTDSKWELEVSVLHFMVTCSLLLLQWHTFIVYVTLDGANEKRAPRANIRLSSRALNRFVWIGNSSLTSPSVFFFYIFASIQFIWTTISSLFLFICAFVWHVICDCARNGSL